MNVEDADELRGQCRVLIVSRRADRAAGPAPLDLLSAFDVLVLFASLVVIGRRGMRNIK